MDNISIYVATHKKMNYHLPNIYKLCQVNAENNGKWEQYIHDNDNEDNISRKNYCYCELTAQYDLWKNNQSEIKGIAHYRRFFSNVDVPSFNQFVYNEVEGCDINSSIINKDQIYDYLDNYDIILQWPISPYYTNAYEDLTKYVFPKDIDVLISVIENDFAEYKTSLERVLSRTGISYLNMFIAKSDVFDQYSEWLFKVLQKIEGIIDISEYDVQHKRIYGYLSEVLLNVYVDCHKLRAKYKYMTILLENSNDVSRFGLIKKEYYPKVVKLFWRRIRTDSYKRYRYLKQIVSAGTCDIVLDDYYKKNNTFGDVYRLMKKYRYFDTSIKKIIIDNNDIPYIESVKSGIRSQTSDKAICIINVFIYLDNNVEAIVSKLYSIYSMDYILNIRIINMSGVYLENIKDKSGKKCFIYSN